MVSTTKKHPTIKCFDDGRAPERNSKFVRCHNPNLRLRTNIRACKGVGQE